MRSIELSEELIALQQNVRRFVEKQIAPHATEWDRHAGFPDSILSELAGQGLTGILVPENLGGAGGNFRSFAIILEELARHDGGLALAVEAHNGLAGEHLRIAATDEQKKRFLAPLAQGKCWGSWCLTEPGSGTDAAAMSTRAVRDGSHWVLSGTKQFITNGSRAGIFVVMAATAPERKNRGISAFIVERGTPGLSFGTKETKHGMRSSDTVAVILDDVRVPHDQLLGRENDAFSTVKDVLTGGRVMISALALGLARGALEESVRYAANRKTFGKAISEHQLIQQKIADMSIAIEAARLLVARNAEALDQKTISGYDAAVTKVFTSEAASRVCREALQILGGYGYLADYNVERYLRDVLLCEIGEGTSEILRVLIARETCKQFETA